MSTWIVYHNCDNLGYPSETPIKNIKTESINIPSSSRSSIFTRKKRASYDAVGNEIFLIIGIGKPKRFYLWEKIFPDKVIPENDGFFTVEGSGVNPKNPIRLDTLDNFDDFKHFCGNFGLGLQNITNHPFSKTLGSLLVKEIK